MGLVHHIPAAFPFPARGPSLPVALLSQLCPAAVCLSRVPMRLAGLAAELETGFCICPAAGAGAGSVPGAGPGWNSGSPGW